MSRPCLDSVIKTYIYSLTPNSLNLDSLDLRIDMIDFRKNIVQHKSIFSPNQQKEACNG